MLRGPAALLLLLLPPADPRSLPPLGFIGPFGPRSRVQASASSAPQPAGRGLDKEEIRTLLKGRTAIVVAADTLDIGLSVAEGLAALGANVVFASRQPKRAARRCGRITAACRRRKGDGACEAAQLDLADAASVWEFAEGVVERDQPLHILVNCADEVLPSFRTGPGGWEQTAGTNHLGPFLLCELLLDQMVGTMRRDEAKSKQLAAEARKHAGRRKRGEAAPPTPLLRPVELRPSPAPLARVVTLGQRVHPTRKRPSPVPGLSLARRNFSSWRAYGDARQANLASHLRLSELMLCVPGEQGDVVQVNVVDPGGKRWLPPAARRLLGLHKAPALQCCFLASSPERGVNGLYFQDFGTEPAWMETSLPYDEHALAEEVYDASRALTASPISEWAQDIGAAMRARASVSQRRTGAAIR